MFRIQNIYQLKIISSLQFFPPGSFAITELSTMAKLSLNSVCSKKIKKRNKSYDLEHLSCQKGNFYVTETSKFTQQSIENTKMTY